MNILFGSNRCYWCDNYISAINEMSLTSTFSTSAETSGRLSSKRCSIISSLNNSKIPIEPSITEIDKVLLSFSAIYLTHYYNLNFFYLLIFLLVYGLIVLSVVSILEFFNLMSKIDIAKFVKIILNTVFVIYIFSFCILMIFFLNFLQLKIIIFILIFVCAASDIGGFIFGKIFKGPKLTKISPKKTISGAFGSIIFSSLTIVVLLFYFTNSFDYFFILIGIFPIASQLGDLIFLDLKEYAKVKDTSNLLPGHGGILDRIDSILLGVPIGFSTLIFILLMNLKISINRFTRI